MQTAFWESVAEASGYHGVGQESGEGQHYRQLPP